MWHSGYCRHTAEHPGGGVGVHLHSYLIDGQTDGQMDGPKLTMPLCMAGPCMLRQSDFYSGQK